jgi:peptide/nickel transport system permease protein
MVVIIGAVLGLAAGYFGGWVDTILARLFDLILSLPYFLFAVSLVSIGFLGGAGLSLTVFVIGVFSFASVARVIRGQVLSIKEKEYIEAARSLGASSWRIIFVDVLPNVVTQLIIYATLLIPVIIIFEAGLSYLGLGIPPPTADWGEMINESQTYLPGGTWWYLLFPSLALVVTTLAFNILGDGVRDALDPRLDRM